MTKNLINLDLIEIIQLWTFWTFLLKPPQPFIGLFLDVKKSNSWTMKEVYKN